MSLVHSGHHDRRCALCRAYFFSLFGKAKAIANAADLYNTRLTALTILTVKIDSMHGCFQRTQIGALMAVLAPAGICPNGRKLLGRRNSLAGTSFRRKDLICPNVLTGTLCS
jgi:hypothetical protein